VRTVGIATTPNLFRTLGVSPALGAGFTDENGIAGKNQVLVISYRLWQGQFGGAKDIVGKRILADGVPHTIVGVMGAEFHYPAATTDYWMPLVFNAANVGAHWAVQNGQFIGRLKSGVSVEAAKREVKTVWPTLRHLNPLWDPGDQYGRDANPTALQE
jgi:hypothetical protein